MIKKKKASVENTIHNQCIRTNEIMAYSYKNVYRYGCYATGVVQTCNVIKGLST